MDGIIELILKLLRVRYTKPWLKAIVKETPNVGTLFGLSVILESYKIHWQCVRFTHKNDLKSASGLAVILFCGQYAIVNNVDNNSVALTFENRQSAMPWTDFCKYWDGTAMLVEKTPYSEEPNYYEHTLSQRQTCFKQYALLTLICIFIIMGLTANATSYNWPIWGVLFVNLIGVCTSYLLLQQQLDIPNRVADKLCGLLKENHCDAVTHSSGSNFLGLFKLSEIGAAFFAVNMFALVFVPRSVFLLAIIAACSLPFTLWSVWYQRFRAKNWCVLCLITLALMWIQAILYFVGGTYKTADWDITRFALGLFCLYGIAVLTLNRIMNVYAETESEREWRYKYIDLKARDEVVNAFEKDAPEFPTDDQECSSLVFGYKNASTRITVFSNPYCGPCASMHARIKSFPSDNVCVSYVLTSFSEELAGINKLIIAAYQQFGAEKTWELLTEWYGGGKKHQEEFFSGLGLDPTTDSVVSEFNKHRRWSKDERLIGTPTVFVNGRKVISPYSVEDYMYMPV